MAQISTVLVISLLFIGCGQGGAGGSSSLQSKMSVTQFKAACAKSVNGCAGIDWGNIDDNSSCADLRTFCADRAIQPLDKNGNPTDVANVVICGN